MKDASGAAVQETPLMAKLRAVRGADFYSLVPAPVLARAMQYVHTDHLEGFEWSTPPDRLYAFVIGTNNYRVQFSMAGDTLKMLCDCPAAEGRAVCKHQVAALFFASHCLNGTSFGVRLTDSPALRKLRGGFMAPFRTLGTEPSSDLEAMVTIRGWLPWPEVKFKDNRTTLAFHERVYPPDKLLSILDQPLRQKDQIARLLQWMDSEEDKNIKVQCLPDPNGAAVPLARSEALAVNAWTEAHWTPEAIELKRCCGDTDVISLGGALVLHPDSMEAGGVTPAGAWDFYFQVRAKLESRGGALHTGPLQLDAHTFNSLAFENAALFRGKSAPRLLQNNAPAAVDKMVAPVLRVDLEQEGSGLRVRLSCTAAEGALPVMGSLQEELDPDLHFESALLTSRRRRDALTRALHLLQGVTDKEVFQGLLDATLDIKNFPILHQNRKAAAVLDRLFKKKKTDWTGLPLATPEGWAPVKSNPAGNLGALVALANTLLHATFLGRASSRRQAVLIAETMPGARAMAEFVGAARDLEVQVDWNGQLLRTVELKVAVRAHDSREIDWFELHPSVMCGSLKIPESRWEEILTGGLVKMKDGSFIIATESSRRALELVAGMVQDLRAAASGKTADNKAPLLLSRMRLLDWVELAEQGVDCEMPPEMIALIESLRDFSSLSAQPLPKGVPAVLRPYQHEGFSWLAFLYQHRLGACLADDMGLGKTLQAITLLAAIKEKSVQGTGAPHLVVLPPTLLFNWAHEIEKFAPDLRVKEYTGTARRAKFEDADVFLTTYELVRRDIETLSKQPFDVVVFDEAQHIKNWAGARSQAVRELQSRFRLCLTGTPLENHVGEYHSILELALPGLLGDRKRFMTNAAAESLALKRARPFVLRRRKADILLDLPPKVESDIMLDFADRQKEYYTRVVGEVRQEVLEAYQEKPSQQAGIIALSALMRLRQICVAPSVLDPEYADRTPKLDHLAEQLEEIVAESGAALVFSQFVRALDVLSGVLDAHGIVHLKMDGKTPMQTRKKMVAGFQDPAGPPVFLISMKTGGAGLNLTRASYVFHLDPWWNPAVENQATDRAHRIGQQHTVFVQRLLMRHSVEEKMMVLKARKMEIFRRIVEGEGAVQSAGAITAEDFQFLLGN